jgi:hypothetical protein
LGGVGGGVVFATDTAVVVVAVEVVVVFALLFR